MATDINATCRAAEMTSIATVAGATAFLFIYSGAQPIKTASPTGTSAITAGITLNTTPFTQGSDGTDANTKLTLAGVPLSGTAVASITPGWYRITNNATDNGTHTVVQGPCSVQTAGVGNVTATNGSFTLSFASSQSALAGTYIQVSGDSTNGSYLITNGGTTTWYIGTPYGGSTNTTTWTSTPGPAGIYFNSTISNGGSVSVTALTFTEGNV